MAEIDDACEVCFKEEGKHLSTSEKHKYARLICDKCWDKLIAAIKRAELFKKQVS